MSNTWLSSGLPSSGIHSNGFSLVRHLVSKSKVDLFGPPPFPSSHSRLVDELLEPTRLYVRALLPLMKAGSVKAAAHITGGGLLENIPRVLPTNVIVEIDASAWIMPASMRWLAETGKMHERELLRTFNCGIGMVIIIDPALKAPVIRDLASHGERPLLIGNVRSRPDDSTDQVRVLHVETLLA